MLEKPPNCSPEHLDKCHNDIKVKELSDNPQDSDPKGDPDPPEPKDVFEPLDHLLGHRDRCKKNVSYK